MVGYFVPHVILALAFNERGQTGLTYGSPLQFWLGWGLGMSITIFSILFEFTFIEGINLWYDLRNNPDAFVVDEEETNDLEDNGSVVFGGITSFTSKMYQL